MRSLSEPHTKRVHDHIYPDADRAGNQRNTGKDAEQGGSIMTVGEVIALLAQYCADEDYLLMCRSIYSIEVNNDSITVYTTDGNSSDITISAKDEA